MQFETVSARAWRPPYVMSRSHSSQMFCPTGKPPVLLTGASGLVVGACTCRSPVTGAGGAGFPLLTCSLTTYRPIGQF